MNPDKCFFLHFIPTNSKKIDIPTYKMAGKPLIRKKEANDLGVTITDDFKFHRHIQKICSTTKNEINRIGRSFTTRTYPFLTNLYKTYVRPHIEYCGNVWNPTYQGDIQKIEKVQNKFTRLMNYGRVLPPEERNRLLKLTTHHERRERGDMIATYKMINNPKLFTPKKVIRGHENNINLPRYQTNIRKHSFSVRVVKKWNDLPNEIVTTKSVNQFKNAYDKHSRI